MIKIDIDEMKKSQNGLELLSKDDVLNFPIEVFPENIQLVINKLNSNFGFEKSILSSSILFTYSTALGNSRSIKINNVWSDNANLWVAIVGERGTAKSPMIGFCVAPLNSIESDFHRNWLYDINIYNELSKKDKEITTKPQRDQRFTSDVTTEGLIKLLSYNQRGIGLYKDELKGFFSGMNQYKGGQGEDKQFYLQAFNNSSYLKNRANDDPIMIESIFLSIIGSIQPTVFNKVSFDNTDDGMIDRWLYIRSDDATPPFSGNDIDESIKAEYTSFIHTAFEQSNHSNTLEWSDDSKEQFVIAINAIRDHKRSNDTRAAVRAYASKMETYLARFIILLTSMRNSNIITTEIVLDAFKLVTYFLSSADRIFTEFDNEKTLNAVINDANAKTTKQEIIALLKAEIGLTNTDIAKRCGVSKQYVGKVYRELGL